MNTTEAGNDRVTSITLTLGARCRGLLVRGGARESLTLVEAGAGEGALFDCQGCEFFVPVGGTHRLRVDGVYVAVRLLSVGPGGRARVRFHAPASVKVWREWLDGDEWRDAA